MEASKKTVAEFTSGGETFRIVAWPWELDGETYFAGALEKQAQSGEWFRTETHFAVDKLLNAIASGEYVLVKKERDLSAGKGFLKQMVKP